MTAATYEVKAVAGETAVTLSVMVPNDASEEAFPTRLEVSSGPMGILTVYGTATVTSGTAMTVEFRFPVS